MVSKLCQHLVRQLMNHHMSCESELMDRHLQCHSVQLATISRTRTLTRHLVVHTDEVLDSNGELDCEGWRIEFRRYKAQISSLKLTLCSVWEMYRR